MQCNYCGDDIGAVRQLRDKEYCCEDHRERGLVARSARAMRDDEGSGFYEAWTGSTRHKTSAKGFSAGYGIALVVLAMGVLMFLPGGAGGTKPPGGGFAYSAPASGLASSVGRFLSGGGRAAMSLRLDFGSSSGGSSRGFDSSSWQSRYGVPSMDWQAFGKAIRIGDMKIWKPTLSMANYNVNFGAEIENRAVSWAVRAADHANYYATKIGVDASRARAEITRYATLDGSRTQRVDMPIPVHFSRGQVYEITMRVSGSRFVTMVNGQVVDAWTDNRLKRGGVGFFAEPGERANLHWVNVDERSGFMERFLSFGMLVTPWQNPLGL